MAENVVDEKTFDKLQLNFNSLMENNSILMGNKIPIKKMKNARIKCNIPKNEKILGLIDMTIMGSAKNAICFTGNNIYWHNSRSSLKNNTNKISYLQLENYTIESGKTEIKISDRVINTLGCSMKAKDIAQFICGLRDEIVNNKIDNMQKCPKCGFVRNAKVKECLKCGIIFEKYKIYIDKKRKIEANSNENKEEDSSAGGAIIDAVIAIGEITNI